MTATETRTQVAIGGGGPVGLATAVELGRRGISCVVVEPRAVVSHARPRCKTVNVRSMEHLRRWGIADRFRDAAPLSTDWSKDLVFCTTLNGYELSRFTGVFGLEYEGDRFPELGQQSPQFVLEEVLREVVEEIPSCRLILGARVSGVEQDEDEVRMTITREDGSSEVIVADYAVGCDGPRSAVRDAIGSQYVGPAAMRPNFGMLFRAPDLWDHVAPGRAIQYWMINPYAPGVMGPLDGKDIWWAAFLGVDEARGEREAQALLTHAIGTEIPLEVLSTDPWTASMRLVDHARVGRAFLAGDAAHLNPPFGGHGLNTGVGDAVDIGWKLAAVLQGWGGAGLLDSYEIERRQVQGKVIAEAEANMTVLPTELSNPNIAVEGAAGDEARRRADVRIQETKHREFHSLDHVLGLGYEGSPIVVDGPSDAAGARPGYRLPHVWLSSGKSVYDELGADFTLLDFGADGDAAAETLRENCDREGIPLKLLRLGSENVRDRYGADLVLVRPDQHVAWRGDDGAHAQRAIDIARGVPV